MSTNVQIVETVLLVTCICFENLRCLEKFLFLLLMVQLSGKKFFERYFAVFPREPPRDIYKSSYAQS